MIAFGLQHLGLLLIVLLLLTGALLHRRNLERVNREVARLSRGPVSRESLYEEMAEHQGSGFNSLATGAWLLFFVAVVYHYFLTPRAFGLSYFQAPVMASWPFGFLVLALLVILAALLLAAVVPGVYRVPGVYSYYELSRWRKQAVIVTIAMLFGSIILSAYAGTLYPHEAPLPFDRAGFLLLLISEVVLLEPVLREAMR